MRPRAAAGLIALPDAFDPEKESWWSPAVITRVLPIYGHPDQCCVVLGRRDADVGVGVSPATMLEIVAEAWKQRGGER